MTRKTGSIALALGLALLPGVRADDCWFDNLGREHCRLSTGVRVGIAVAIIVAMIIALASLFYYRRRRMQHANLAYVNNQQTFTPGGAPGPGQPYGQGYAPEYQGGYAGPGYGYPPQQQYGSSQQQYGTPPPGTPYGYNQDFTPPTGPPPAHVAMGDQPPQYFAPPRNPPPSEGKM
ncbi:hypothetical protein EVG20_g6404 [Dentipellis fragilis]|uniref:Uncharacterized protein n=1 Tax=Dentipellis fragilis TaxID=205917 RepID=A0A4Y9YNX7_9AGAM|nr:hypothetical protein EVG20_g6404 [Dentipellis fragilis]